MKDFVEIDSFDVKVKFYDRDIQSRGKKEDGKIRLCAVSCDSFAFFIEKKESGHMEIVLLDGKDKWKLKYIKTTRSLELLKQPKKIHVQLPVTFKVGAFDRMCQTAEKLLEKMSWKHIEYLKQSSSEIEGLPKSFKLSDCNKENIGLNKRVLNDSKSGSDVESSILDEPKRLKRETTPEKILSNSSSDRQQQKTPNQSEISPRNFYSNITVSSVKCTPPRSISTSCRISRKPAILTNGLRNSCPQTSKPSTSSVLSAPISHATVKEINNCGSVNFDNSEEITGLRNIGNSCYMNVILQSLFNVECFRNEFLANYDQFLKDKDVKQGCLLLSVCHLFSVMKLRRVERRHLESVKEAFVKKAETFAGTQQHDAQEFLTFFLDILREELLAINKEKSFEQYKNSVLINFETVTTENIRCNKCGNLVTKQESNMQMSLLMPDRPSLVSALKQFMSEEEVEYTCEKCENKSGVLSHKFYRLPRVLILHLKRYNKLEKKGSAVMIPRYLNLSNYCDETTISPSLSSDISPSDNFLRDVIEEFERNLENNRETELNNFPDSPGGDMNGTRLRFKNRFQSTKKKPADTLLSDSSSYFAKDVKRFKPSNGEEFSNGLMDNVNANKYDDGEADLFDSQDVGKKGPYKKLDFSCDEDRRDDLLDESVRHERASPNSFLHDGPVYSGTSMNSTVEPTSSSSVKCGSEENQEIPNFPVNDRLGTSPNGLLGGNSENNSLERRKEIFSLQQDDSSTNSCGLLGGSPAVKQSEADVQSQATIEECELDENDEELQKAIQQSKLQFEEERRSKMQEEEEQLQEALEKSLYEAEAERQRKLEQLESITDDEDYDDETQPGFSYRLVSIISHSGSAHGGHYTCSVLRSSDGKWYRCNDNEVTSLYNQDEKSLLNECQTYGYIFFYVNK
ncbi:DgyrCDS12507 [Dimorphilus gyrociliatus]|uniref:Ubiquitin carboxyl-terminal hydrolase n=1 Tax=Dimorphilus gyrociliatus TaxID=2664684 RepID=A0A7I8W827_9ANNE|nr:DgyrCDS12507 [Dimorphilus gyrociliatus]